MFWGKRVIDSTAWRRNLNHPELKLHFHYQNLGNTSVYGHALALFPSYTFYFRNLPLQLTFGSGLSYVTARFSEGENPSNRAIGSHINNITQLRLGWVFRLRKWSLTPHIGLTHYSNLSTIEPNLGLNHIGIGITLLRLKNSKIDSQSSGRSPKNTWYRQIRYSFGLYDSDRELADDNHTYSPVHSLGIIIGKRYRAYGRVYGQLKYTRNSGERDFHGPSGLHNVTILMGNELTLGSFSIFGGLGTYLYERYDPVEPVFLEGGAMLYFIEKDGYRTYISSNIKSHLGVAEYGEISIGIEW